MEEEKKVFIFTKTVICWDCPRCGQRHEIDEDKWDEYSRSPLVCSYCSFPVNPRNILYVWKKD